MVFDSWIVVASINSQQSMGPRKAHSVVPSGMGVWVGWGFGGVVGCCGVISIFNIIGFCVVSV